SEPSPTPSSATQSLPSASEPSASAPAKTPSSARANAGPSEADLLEAARRSLASDPARALALTSEHAARFPHGILGPEREVIAIEARRRPGRGAEADRRAATFGKSYPGSAHQRKVEGGTP